MIIDRDNQTRHTISADSRQDCDYTTEEIGHLDFAAIQTNVTGDLSIPGIDEVPSLITGALPSGAALGLSATSPSPDSQRVMSPWQPNHPSFVEDITQDEYDFFVNLQYDYDPSGVDIGLQDERPQGYDSPARVVNGQDTA